jgi:flavin-dependent dehydrogenase
MVVTGEDGVAVQSRYPNGQHGRSLARRDLDLSLIEQATQAGAEFEPGTRVRAAVRDERRQALVRGVTTERGGVSATVPARVVIGADGRCSTLAFGLGLAERPARPRRWAIGAYFEGVDGVSAFGEMHLRRGMYIGLAPMPGGLANVCLVKPWGGAGTSFGDPAALLRRVLANDEVLGSRFRGAHLTAPPVVLGPLAIDVRRAACDGLLLAGDAAGFIDPMTGDGMRFAFRGGELAALTALRTLDRGWAGAHAELALVRRREFSMKWRFNRTLRAIVGSPAALRVGRTVASHAPAALRAIVRHAGDCGLQP